MKSGRFHATVLAVAWGMMVVMGLWASWARWRPPGVWQLDWIAWALLVSVAGLIVMVMVGGWLDRLGTAWGWSVALLVAAPLLRGWIPWPMALYPQRVDELARTGVALAFLGIVLGVAMGIYRGVGKWRRT